MAKFKYAPKQVIENKLLASLEDGSDKVAIVVNKTELDLLISGLSMLAFKNHSSGDFLADMRKLRAGAFPECPAFIDRD